MAATTSHSEQYAYCTSAITTPHTTPANLPASPIDDCPMDSTIPAVLPIAGFMQLARGPCSPYSPTPTSHIRPPTHLRFRSLGVSLPATPGLAAPAASPPLWSLAARAELTTIHCFPRRSRDVRRPRRSYSIPATGHVSTLLVESRRLFTLDSESSPAACLTFTCPVMVG